MENVKEIADKFFDEQEKLNVSFDSREAFIEGYKLAQAMVEDEAHKAYLYGHEVGFIKAKEHELNKSK